MTKSKPKGQGVAIFSMNAKIISRKTGRSSTAAAAYRSGEKIEDQRTGEIHDYTKKKGVESAHLVMPSASDWQPTRAELWNAVELKNKRQDSQVAREFTVALPSELSAHERQKLAVDFAKEIADRYSIAADVAIHAPSKGGDDRNIHAHILTSTNKVIGEGFGNKCRELDLVAHTMGGGIGQANEIEHLRERWAELTNERLKANGIEEQIDHRSLEVQGIDRAPTVHLGVTATAIERRTGEPSRRTLEAPQKRFERGEVVSAATALVDGKINAIEQSIKELQMERKPAKEEPAESKQEPKEAISLNELLEEQRQRRMKLLETLGLDSTKKEPKKMLSLKETIAEMRAEKELERTGRPRPEQIKPVTEPTTITELEPVKPMPSKADLVEDLLNEFEQRYAENDLYFNRDYERSELRTIHESKAREYLEMGLEFGMKRASERAKEKVSGNDMEM